MKTTRELVYALMLCSLTLCFALAAYAQSLEEPSVVIYDDPNLQGRSRSFRVGNHRLFNLEDFNDVASSMKVSSGLGVRVYEHADEGGGFGEWVDFLEDQPNLSRYGFDNKISYLEVFTLRRGSEVYVRNAVENGRFIEGRWVMRKVNPVNPTPVVAPSPKPPNVFEIASFEATPSAIRRGQMAVLRWRTVNAERVLWGEQEGGADSIRAPRVGDPSGASPVIVRPFQTTTYVLRAEQGAKSATKTVTVQVATPPPPPSFCTIRGLVSNDRPEYGTKVSLRRLAPIGGQPLEKRVFVSSYVFTRVPTGRYMITVTGRYPSGHHGSSLRPSPRAQAVMCQPNGNHQVPNFKIESNEGE